MRRKVSSPPVRTSRISSTRRRSTRTSQPVVLQETIPLHPHRPTSLSLTYSTRKKGIPRRTPTVPLRPRARRLPRSTTPVLALKEEEEEAPESPEPHQRFSALQLSVPSMPNKEEKKPSRSSPSNGTDEEIQPPVDFPLLPLDSSNHRPPPPSSPLLPTPPTSTALFLPPPSLLLSKRKRPTLFPSSPPSRPKQQLQLQLPLNLPPQLDLDLEESCFKAQVEVSTLLLVLLLPLPFLPSQGLLNITLFLWLNDPSSNRNASSSTLKHRDRPSLHPDLTEKRREGEGRFERRVRG